MVQIFNKSFVNKIQDSFEFSENMMLKNTVNPMLMSVMLTVSKLWLGTVFRYLLFLTLLFECCFLLILVLFVCILFWQGKKPKYSEEENI